MATTTRKPPARKPLTRAGIADAAVRIMDAEGLDAVSMRRLGRELGVEAMSLYNHVADKDDLFTAMIESVLRGFELPPKATDAWDERVRHLSRSYRAVLRAHPNVLQLIAENKKPSTSLDAIRPLEIALATLKAAGLSDQDVIDGYKMFVGFVIGFVMMETRGMFAPDNDLDPATVVAELPADALPNLVSLFPRMCTSDPDSEFEFGIGVMIEGLRARIDA